MPDLSLTCGSQLPGGERRCVSPGSSLAVSPAVSLVASLAPSLLPGAWRGASALVARHRGLSALGDISYSQVMRP